MRRKWSSQCLLMGWTGAAESESELQGAGPRRKCLCGANADGCNQRPPFGAAGGPQWNAAMAAGLHRAVLSLCRHSDCCLIQRSNQLMMMLLVSCGNNQIEPAPCDSWMFETYHGITRHVPH
eukprot:12274-Chlamydomonas_euryale.AAC.6